MPAYDYDMAIIGGGAAGLTVAAGAAQLGARTLLIEKEPALGGDCLHFGCVPSKTLIKTARVYHHMRQAAAYGLPEVSLPGVDYRHVAARIQEVIARIQVHDSVERFCKLGVQVEFGEPTFIDEHAVSLNGLTISAKHWLIATGSSPARPGVESISKINYITNKDIFSLEELPKSMLVLGAGPIAMEMAQAFCRLGTSVQVIQRSGQILSREDKDMADIIMASMAAEGVTFFLDQAVEDAKERAGNKELTLVGKDGSKRVVSGQFVLLAQGREANTQGLGLEDIGVDCDRHGIKVDERMRTSHNHIYAAGDVNGRFQFTHAAGYEGGIVVANAVFHLPRKADYTWMPWCTYTDPELASIGMNEKAAAGAGIEYEVWTEEFSENDRALTEGAENGRLKMLLDSKKKVLGVQIAGPRAGELIGEWAAILGGGVKLSTLAGIVHPYPTLTEINKRVAGSLLATRIFSPTVQKGLKFFFQLKGPVQDPCSPIKS